MSLLLGLERQEDMANTTNISFTFYDDPGIYFFMPQVTMLFEFAYSRNSLLGNHQ